MSSQLASAKDIFLSAVELATPGERAAFLDEACCGDQQLRRQVELLLQAHDRPESLLDKPALPVDVEITVAPAARSSELAEHSGTQFGPYKLLQQIGEGGMGVVYVAEQKVPVERRVALKIIKPGMDSRQVLARFEAERQALALMDHPHVAKVLDAGESAAGRPYFVMELVKGVPITQYCDEHQLTPRQRLELFLPVCQAIQHAHQKGIIHRDLKPSNVLVAEYDEQPVAKVIDFGVAKAIGQRLTDKTVFTEIGQVVGTIEYMSPEQAKLNQLDIDTRTDIYSLGVLLYELLTGETPFDRKRLRSAAFDEMLRIIREEEPPRPSTKLSSSQSLPSIAASRQTEPHKLTKLLHGELDWILLKCLDKDRSRRYETANGLGMDIQRYLDDEPVVACPPSTAYCFRKFAWRNRRALVTAGLIGCALIIGTVLSTWQAIRATRAERLAAQLLVAESDARRAAETARNAASINFERAREVVQRILNRVVNEQLTDVPGVRPVRKALLEDALEFNEKLLAEPSTDQEMRFATALGCMQLGWIQRCLGGWDDAESTYRRAVELLEGLTADWPRDLRYRAELGDALLQLCDTQHDAAIIFARPEKTSQIEILRRVIQLQESVTAAEPDSTNLAYGLARALLLLARWHKNEGQTAEAEAAFRRVLSISECVLAKEPDHPAHLRAELVALNSIAELQMAMDPTQAEATLRRAAIFATRFPANTKGDGYLFDFGASAIAAVDRTFAALYLRTGRRAEAQAALRREIATWEKVLAELPDDVNYRDLTAEAYKRLGDALTEPANRQEAERLYRQAIQSHEQLVAKFPEQAMYRKELSDFQFALGNLLLRAGRGGEAERHFRQALALSEKLNSEIPSDPRYQKKIADIENRLGQVFHANQPTEAKNSHHRAVALYEALINRFPTDPAYREGLGHSYRLLAFCSERTTNAPERERLLSQAAAQLEVALADAPRNQHRRFFLADSYRSLADDLTAQQRAADAEANYRKAAGLLASLPAETLMESATNLQWRRQAVDLCFANLVQLLAGGNRIQEAQQVHQQAIAFYEKLAAERPDEPYFGEALAKHQAALAELKEEP